VLLNWRTPFPLPQDEKLPRPLYRITNPFFPRKDFGAPSPPKASPVCSRLPLLSSSPFPLVPSTHEHPVAADTVSDKSPEPNLDTFLSPAPSHCLILSAPSEDVRSTEPIQSQGHLPSFLETVTSWSATIWDHLLSTLAWAFFFFRIWKRSGVVFYAFGHHDTSISST